MRQAVFGALALAAASWAAPAGAVAIDSQILLLPGNATTVDRVRFDVLAGGTVNFDLLSWERSHNNHVDANADGEAAFFDTHIRLFVDDGSLDVGDEIASNDNSAFLGADGSIGGADSYLAVTLASGSYILAVGASLLSAADAVLGINTNGGGDPHTCHGGFPFSVSCFGLGDHHDHGDYRLTLTGDAVLADVRADAAAGEVPEPGALALLGLGLAALGCARRRGR